MQAASPVLVFLDRTSHFVPQGLRSLVFGKPAAKEGAERFFFRQLNVAGRVVFGGLLFGEAGHCIVVAKISRKRYPGSDRAYGVAVVLIARTFHCTVCLCQHAAAGFAAALVFRYTAGRPVLLLPVAARPGPRYRLPER